MKGIIFLKLEEFVEASFGDMAWDNILNLANVESDGAYTSIALYDDEEFYAIVRTLCQQHDIEMKAAQFAFGQWIHDKLLDIAPKDAHQYKDTFSFLRGVNDVIHREVMKIHPDAILPEFTFLEETENRMLMVYTSPRGLCYFCEGIIDALITRLQEHIDVKQIECVHEGDARCVFELLKQ